MDTLTITIRQPDSHPLAPSPYRETTMTMRTNKRMASLATLDAGPLLRWLFRQFNAADGEELISLLDIAMPSLSVGDEVHLSDGDSTRRFICRPFEWEEVMP